MKKRTIITILTLVGSLLWRVPRFLGVLFLASYRVAMARRKARQAFYLAMIEGGMPEPLARRLRKEFPKLFGPGTGSGFFPSIHKRSPPR